MRVVADPILVMKISVAEGSRLLLSIMIDTT